eukprot:8512868-Pyramimonas_sp.AAC.1
MLKWGATSAGQMSAGNHDLNDDCGDDSDSSRSSSPEQKTYKKTAFKDRERWEVSEYCVHRAMRKAFWKSFMNKNQKGKGSVSNSKSVGGLEEENDGSDDESPR